MDECDQRPKDCTLSPEDQFEKMNIKHKSKDNSSDDTEDIEIENSDNDKGMGSWDEEGENFFDEVNDFNDFSFEPDDKGGKQQKRKKNGKWDWENEIEYNKSDDDL